MTLPIAPVVLPADLVGEPNGRIDGTLLVDVGPSGLLHHTAARAWRALVADAARSGLSLTYTYGGTYRTLAAQTVLFESRYSPSGTGGGCKTYQGRPWCKKSPNLATAAVPGTSNHGIGIAVDSAAGDHPKNATGISAHPQWPWFRANVERFGFSWELQSEPWHIRYVTGDTIPQAVLDHEGPTTTPPTPGDSPTMIVLDATFTTPVTTMVWDGIYLAWVANGHADAVLTNAKVQRQSVNRDQLYGVILASRTTTPVPHTLDGDLAGLWNQRAL